MNSYLDKSFQSWRRVLDPVLTSEKFRQLGATLLKQYDEHTVYPEKENLFRAFQLCDYNDLKVVIIAQDPYHNKDAATGLCFANPDEYTKISPSLRNIIREVENECQETYTGFNTDLEHWAKQGVLLLNTALTVEQGQPGSHLAQWAFFTKAVISIIAHNNPGTIFMLWGKKAQAFATPSMDEHCHVLKAAHPAAEVYKNNAGFFGCEHFTAANKLIASANGEGYEINWLGKVSEIA